METARTEVPVVLLVEDNADDVLLIRRALRRAGLAIDLHLAADGQAAVDYLAALSEAAARPRPALMLLDLKLPLRSGHEVLAWMRARGEFATLPVVVLTSSTEDADIQQAYRAGANSYLGKPVSSEALEQLLQVLSLYWLKTNVVAPLESR